MTVSILLPIYNRAQTLRRCLDSILAQTFTDWELIAVDDGSSDGSAEMVTGDPRFRVLRHEKNRGASAARNTALAAAQGEFVALIDSDDEWLPDKLERQLRYLAESGADACGCEYWLEENGRASRVRLPPPASWANQLHTECRLGNGTTLLARRTCAEAVGTFDEALRLYEDWDWVLRLVERFRYGVVEEPLARVHVSGVRSPEAYADGAQRFLTRHNAEFRRLGFRYQHDVWSFHFEAVAGYAFAHRRFQLGTAYTLASVFVAPWRNPILLGALFLAPIDFLFRTRLIQKAAQWRRRS